MNTTKQHSTKGKGWKMGYYKTNAAAGKHFVLTEAGYNKTPDHVKPERAVGKPIPLFADSVPTSWLKNGWVEEVAI